jgi:hypothetical protein
MQRKTPEPTTHASGGGEANMRSGPASGRLAHVSAPRGPRGRLPGQSVCVGAGTLGASELPTGPPGRARSLGRANRRQRGHSPQC